MCLPGPSPFPSLPALACGLLLGPLALGASAAEAPVSARLCRDLGEGLGPPPGLAGAAEAVTLLAEEAELRPSGASLVTGRVVVQRGTRTLAADSLTLYRDAEVVDALEGLRYWDQGFYAHALEAQVDLGADQAWLRDVHYRVLPAHARGDARSAQLGESGLAFVEHGTYTTCDPGSDEWVLKARQITLDRGADLGTARDVSVSFLGVPVFYTPWIDFSLSGARKSGVLPPVVGSSSSSGLQLLVPYYWNIAPERDATLGVGAMTKRGAALQGEYRYLMPNGQGDLQVEYLPHDREYGSARGLGRVRHQQTFASRWWTALDAASASDATFLEDLGTNLAVSSTQFLERRLDVGTGGSWWSALGRLQNYQTMDPDLPRVDRPYGRLPQLLISASTPLRSEGFAASLHGEEAYFTHGDRVEGNRVDLMPSVSYPLRTPATFLVPRASLRYTGYQLTNADPGTVADPRPPGSGDAPSRSLPIVSLDTGAFFDRELVLAGRPRVQTLEPRAYYLYVPYRDQADLPVFDTSLYTFGFYQLFRENRFSGADRVGDANQLTLAVTSRLADAGSGRDLGRISVGQVQYFRDREVQLPGAPVETGQDSDLVAEVAAVVGRHWQARTSWQWDTGEQETDKLSFVTRYLPEPGSLVNLAYRYLRDPSSEQNDLDQTDLSFRWQMSPQLSLLGRWNYDLPDRQVIDTFAGIEYETCCWGVRAVARRYLRSSGEDYSTAVFLQLVLKGLGGFGAKTVSFLEEQIPGYENYF